jgi:uronate dehydrogenase
MGEGRCLTEYDMNDREQYPNILITGAAGYLGGVLRRALRGTEFRVRLSDKQAPPYPLEADEDFVPADLADFERVQAATQNIDAIVHLGGFSVEGPWDAILGANIVGTYNVFEAAKRAGVKRVVFASTHHVVGFYRRERRIGVDAAPRPDSRYAASKVFGEALGRLYADKHGLSVICQRIGVARPKPPHRRALSAWLSEEDFVALTLRCLRARDIHFEIVYGVSANRASFWDNRSAQEIGYSPTSSAEDFEREILSEPDRENDVERLFQGGQYTGMEFDGDLSKID